jgi:hypothetical protein
MKFNLEIDKSKWLDVEGHEVVEQVAKKLDTIPNGQTQLITVKRVE